MATLPADIPADIPADTQPGMESGAQTHVAPNESARSMLDREIRIKLAKRTVRLSAPPATSRTPKQTTVRTASPRKAAPKSAKPVKSTKRARAAA